MNNTGYVMFDSESMTISDVHSNPGNVMNELIDKGYTVDEMHANGFELCMVITDGCTWCECVDTVEY